jgi:formylglycine-generating enzyme required for sulfatase activity
VYLLNPTQASLGLLEVPVPVDGSTMSRPAAGRIAGLWQAARLLFVVVIAHGALNCAAADPTGNGATAAARHAQQPEVLASEHAQRREFDDCSGAAWCPRMVVVPGGTFVMGSPLSEAGRFEDEGPQRRVTIRSFAVGKFPVTRRQWEAFAGAANKPLPTSVCAYALRLNASWKDPGFPQSDDHPVVCVTWGEAQDYARWLSKKTGHSYRLLTEAEREYAARGGTTTAFPWGDEASHEHANYGKDTCCAPQTSGRDRWEFTSPVGSFPPNPFGLYDMHGNVFEWVQDCYATSYIGHSVDGSAYQPTECRYRVARGGVYGDRPDVMRSAGRNYAPAEDDTMTIANYRSAGFGLRVARELP